MRAIHAGSISPNNHQGLYAEGFVTSIVYAAGFDAAVWRFGQDLDIEVRQPAAKDPTHPEGQWLAPRVSLQVKSWSTGTFQDDDTLHYSLKIGTYEALRAKSDVRTYLIVCLVPPDPLDYSNADHTQLTHHQAAYWQTLRHAPSPRPNASSKTVLVPRSQLLTPATLTALVRNDEQRATVR